MRKASAVLVVVLASWLLVTPASAITLSFFASYTSAGALVVQTAFPFGANSLVSVNFDPAHFSPAEANTVYLAVAGLLGGVPVTSVTPADLATAGLSPVAAIETLQQLFLFGNFADWFWVVRVYRRAPSGVGIDIYRFVDTNNFEFTLTLQG